MGVKKKHETFEENALNEPAKSNRMVPAEWLPYRNQTPRSMQTTQHTVNGESNYITSKQVDLLDISTHGISAPNKNYNSYLSVYDRENMSSAGGESKSKHTQRSTRTYRNQECSSNSAAIQHTIVISDEEDEDEDTHRSQHAHNQELDDGMCERMYLYIY